jgi:hypothetical protein
MACVCVEAAVSQRGGGGCALDPDRRPALDRDEVLQDPLDVLSICSSLVATIDREGLDRLDDHYLLIEPVVVLAHYSVKEYLVSERVLKSKSELYIMNSALCHQFLAKWCVQYLLQFGNTSDIWTDADLQEFVLAVYSARTWMGHYKLVVTPEPKISELVVELFKAESAFSNMLRMQRRSRRSIHAQVNQFYDEPLHTACMWGLLNLIQRLVYDTDVDINEAGFPKGDTALSIASTYGHLSVV